MNPVSQVGDARSRAQTSRLLLLRFVKQSISFSRSLKPSVQWEVVNGGSTFFVVVANQSLKVAPHPS